MIEANRLRSTFSLVFHCLKEEWKEGGRERGREGGRDGGTERQRDGRRGTEERMSVSYCCYWYVETPAKSNLKKKGLLWIHLRIQSTLVEKAELKQWLDRGVKDTRRTQLLEPTKQSSQGLTETTAAIMEPFPHRAVLTWSQGKGLEE